MNLKKFRIKNYKSIKDTGWCWLASDITTLAGKNESGKSCILEALRDFDVDIDELEESAIPIDKEENPEISMLFDTKSDELKKIIHEANLEIDKNISKQIASEGLVIIKDKEGNYYLEEEKLDLFNKAFHHFSDYNVNNLESIINKIIELDLISDDKLPRLERPLEKKYSTIKHYMAIIDDCLSKKSELNDNEISALQTYYEDLQGELDFLNERKIVNYFIDSLINYIPNVILFSDFTDILPYRISFAEAPNNQIVRDFAQVAGLDIEKISTNNNAQQRRNILGQSSATISGDFKEYWKQEEVHIEAEPDGNYLLLWIKERDNPIRFTPAQRSKGLQWFLSFYLRLKSQSSNKNILLIDEPGLFLHAKAQSDVLEVLQEQSKYSQIIKTTHSPYLIDSKRLDRIRLVLKDSDNFTYIENKPHKHADVETLTPIMTAIGFDLRHEFSIASNYNVLVEGITDYYLLNALLRYTQHNILHKIHIIPCMGVEQFRQLTSLLIGWNLSFVAVLDNEAKGKKIASTLRNTYHIKDDYIILISTEKNHSIEDIFTQHDLNDYILDDIKKTDDNTLNSKFIKDNVSDKTLLSKLFFENVIADDSRIQLSETTITNFHDVFDKIAHAFSIDQ